MKLDTNIRNANIKCDFCPYSFLDEDGKLRCPATFCKLSVEDLSALITIMFGKPPQKVLSKSKQDN